MIHLEVVGARDSDQESASLMSDQLKLERAEETKARANHAFREKRYDEALILFKEASSYVSKLS